MMAVVLQRIQKDDCVVFIFTALTDEFLKKWQKLKAHHFLNKIAEFDRF
jgi:hypothetical protein